ncbi:hypothetical protein AG4045_011040 [Apium graveolens]|uniref:Phosducin domain-containing protein n=1 Tax=Apium graveolens TaxID=4045 RepID=A0A6L5BC20_APIGR|nr:hypothetical protein AG4045_011040 [Apium graveolens]
MVAAHFANAEDYTLWVCVHKRWKKLSELISQASPDVWVVVILYKDGYAECGVLMACLEELAAKYPVTKFVKIISTDCIPNYHDRNLPTLLVFNSGAVKANYVGMHNFGRRCIPEGVALVLCQSDHILNDGLGNQCLMKLERGLCRKL